LLKIESDLDLPYTPFANSDNIKVGEWVLAVGNPYNLTCNSGGALVNTRGELVGINTAISSRTGSFIGYSFAVPSNIAKKIVDDLLEFGAVQEAILGMQKDLVNQLI